LWAFSLANLELEIAVAMVGSIVVGFGRVGALKMGLSELQKLGFLKASTLVVGLASVVL
jgi:hypothetical protein